MAFKEKIPSLKEQYWKNMRYECDEHDPKLDEHGNFVPHKFSHYNRYLHEGMSPIWSPLFWDTFFRLHIGKTDDINVAMCSHDATINREQPEHYCRVCHKDLSIVKGRVNDYLVLRHPQCTKPICCDCAKNNPDEFYKAFEKGTQTAIAAAHELYGVQNVRNKVLQKQS
jgi:hypothetical protein